MSLRNKFLLFFLVLGIVPLFFFVIAPDSSNPNQEYDIKNQREIAKNIGEDPPQEAVLLVHTFTPSSTIVTMEYDQTPKFLSAWEVDEDEIVINGAYFLEDYSPAGLLVVNGERVGKLMFDEDKSGLFFVKQGRVGIRDLQKFPLGPNEHFDFALQSFPFLVRDGVGAVEADSGKKARRTAVGVDSDNTLYVLSVTTQELSLYEFMNEVVKTGIPFTSVLNLDGGPSTGIYGHWDGQEFLSDSISAVSSIVRLKKVK